MKKLLFFLLLIKVFTIFSSKTNGKESKEEFKLTESKSVETKEAGIPAETIETYYLKRLMFIFMKRILKNKSFKKGILLIEFFERLYEKSVI